MHAEYLLVHRKVRLFHHDNMRDANDLETAAKEIAAETGGARCEIKSLILRSKKGEIEIVERNTKIANEDPYGKYALVSKQSFDEQHKLTGTTLEINSPQLLAMLKEVVKYYPGEPLDFSTKFTIEDPYVALTSVIITIMPLFSCRAVHWPIQCTRKCWGIFVING